MSDRFQECEDLRLGEDDRSSISGGQYKPANNSSLYSSHEGVTGGHNAQPGQTGGHHSVQPGQTGGHGVQPGQSEESGGKDHDIKMKPNGISFNSLDLLSRRKDLPEDLACFLLQQKQRQARQETTMRSFPSSFDLDQEKQELKRKRGSHEDPLSHRVIEKRRRDRMNSCLADLSRLIPNSYTKKGRGRIEKTEIIEMAIKHMRHLQNHPCQADECDMIEEQTEDKKAKTSNLESFRVGYHESLTETMHFLVEKEGLYDGDSTCIRLINHLQKHFETLSKNNAKLTREPPSMKHPPGKIWTFKPKAEGGSESEGYKTEVSDESGYNSAVKAEEGGINLSTHAPSGSSTPFNIQDHVEGPSNRETDKEADSRQEFYSPERKPSFVSEHNIKSSEMDQDGPSDLSMKGSDSLHEGDFNRYKKFKSNIQKRYSHQDPIQPSHQSSSSGKIRSTTSLSSSNGGSDWQHSGINGNNPHLNSSNSGSSCNSSRISGIDPSPEHETHTERKRSGGDRQEARDTVVSGGGLYGERHSDCDTAGSRMVESVGDECQHRHKAIPSSTSSVTPQPSLSVPIFALNSRGSYYVPMTVDLSVISPFMSLYREESCPILHPVTISVNFQSVHVDPKPISIRESSTRSSVLPHTSVIKHWKDRVSS